MVDSTKITHDNNRHAYRISMDIAKEGSAVWDLTPYFKGRVGDNRFGLEVSWFYQGKPMNVDGMKPYIEGNVGNYTLDDKKNLQLNSGASVVRYVGDPSDCGPGGNATYYFPEQMFPKEGIFKGYIGLFDDRDNSKNPHISGVTIWFKVLPGIAEMGHACDYYISELEKLLEHFKTTMDNHDKDYQAKLKQALEDIRNKYNLKAKQAEDGLNNVIGNLDTINAGLKSTATSVKGIQAQIDADNLETRSEHTADIALLNQQIDRKVNNIVSYPETYSDLTAVAHAYPNGTPRLIVTDDGHRAVWRNNQWIDGGVYQAVGETNKIINNSKLDNFTKKTIASWTSPVLVDFDNSKLTVTNGFHLIGTPDMGYNSVAGDTFFVLEEDKKELAQKIENAKTDEEKQKLKKTDLTKKSGGFFVTFVPTNNPSTQFKFYGALNNVPKDEIYVGWINYPNIFNFIFQAIDARNAYVSGHSKDDYLGANNTPRNNDMIISSSKWIFDFDENSIWVPNGTVAFYKGDRFNIKGGKYSIPKVDGATGYFLYFNFYQENKSWFAKIIGDPNPSKGSNKQPYIGYVETNWHIFHINNLTSSLGQTPRVEFVGPNKPTVDFKNKIVHFPQYWHFRVDGQEVALKNFDLKLPTFKNGGYFIAIDPSGLYSNDLTKIFKVYEDTSQIDTKYMYFFGWIETNTKKYDFYINGSSEEEETRNSFSALFPWKNKKITCLGDSITQGDNGEGSNIDSYVPRMTKWLKTTPTNMGRNGSKITKQDGRNDSFVERMSAIKDQDIVTIFGGINDFQWNAPLGTISDKVDNPTTFYGALKYLVVNLSKQNPNVKLLFITPMKTTKFQYHTFDDNGELMKNANGNTQLDFVNAIKQVASYYSIPVLDMYNCSNYSPYIPTQVGHDAFTADGLHPTEHGYERIAQTIGKVINNL